MGSRTRRGSAAEASGKDANGVDEGPDRRVLEAIREATGAADEDIRQTLAECNNDVNEATSRLIDNPFQAVEKKKKKPVREADKPKDSGRTTESRRASGKERGKGDRVSRGASERLGERPHDRGRAGARPGSGAKVTENGSLSAEPSADWDPQAVPEVDKAVAAPSPRPTYSRAPGPAPAASSEPPGPIRSSTGAPTMADLFKRAPPAPTPPPAAIAPPTPAQQHHATTSHLDEPHLGPSDLAALGGRAVSPPPKVARPTGAASLAPRAPSPPRGHTPTPSSSVLSHQDTQVNPPSSSGLTSAAPARFSEATTSGQGGPAPGWGTPKQPQAASSTAPQPSSLAPGGPSQSMGSSLLSSLQGTSNSLLDNPRPPASHDSAIPSANHLSMERPRTSVDSSRDQPLRNGGPLGSHASSTNVDLPTQFGNINFGSGFAGSFDSNAHNQDTSALSNSAATTSFSKPLGGDFGDPLNSQRQAFPSAFSQAPSTSQAATMGSVGGPSGGQPRPQQPPVAQPLKDPIVGNPRQGSLGLLEPSQLPAASSAGASGRQQSFPGSMTPAQSIPSGFQQQHAQQPSGSIAGGFQQGQQQGVYGSQGQYTSYGQYGQQASMAQRAPSGAAKQGSGAFDQPYSVGFPSSAPSGASAPSAGPQAQKQDFQLPSGPPKFPGQQAAGHPGAPAGPQAQPQGQAGYGAGSSHAGSGAGSQGSGFSQGPPQAGLPSGAAHQPAHAAFPQHAPGYGHMQPQNPAMAGYGGYQQSYAPQAYSQGAYPYQQYHMQQAFPYQGNQGYPPQAASGYGNGPQAYQGGKQYSGYQGQLGHGLYSSHHHQQQQHQQQQHRGGDAYGYPAAHMGQYGAYGAAEPPQAYDPQRRGPAGGYYQGANGQAPPYKAS